MDSYYYIGLFHYYIIITHYVIISHYYLLLTGQLADVVRRVQLAGAAIDEVLDSVNLLWNHRHYPRFPQ